MKSIWKRSLSLFLAIVMIVGMIPMSVFAEEGDSCAHENTEICEQEATCTEEGLVELVCLDCSEVLEEEILPVLDHSWEGNTCAVCGEVKEEAPQDEEVLDEQEEPEEELSAGTFGLSREDRKVIAESGIAWIDTDILEPPANATEQQQLLFMGSIVSSGKFRNAVLRALGRYSSSTAASYTVYYEGLNVADSGAFMQNQELGTDLSDKITAGEKIQFYIEDADEAFWAEVAFKDADDITITIDEIVSVGAPADLDAEVEKAMAAVHIDGFTLEEIMDAPSYISHKVLAQNTEYQWPERGARTRYDSNPRFEFKIQEALEGSTKTGKGGIIALKDTTQKYTIKFFEKEGDTTAEKTITLWQGESFAESDVPVLSREDFVFKGWSEEIKYTPDRSMNYYGVWDAIKTYTIRYYKDTIGGELYDEFPDVKEDSETPKPENFPDSYEGTQDGKDGTYYVKGWVDGEGNSVAKKVTKDADYVADWGFMEKAPESGGDPVDPPTPPQTVFTVTYHEYDFSTNTWETWTDETYTKKGEYGFVENPGTEKREGLINYGWIEIEAGTGFLGEDGKLKDVYCDATKAFDFTKPVAKDTYLVEAVRVDLNSNGVPDSPADKFALYEFQYEDVTRDPLLKPYNSGLEYNEALVKNTPYMEAVTGKSFTGWNHVTTEDKGDYIRFVLEPQFMTDKNGNGVDDGYETVEFEIHLPNGDEVFYEDYVAGGSQCGRITFNGVAPVSAGEGTYQYLVDTKNGTKIEVKAAGNAYAESLSVQRNNGGEKMSLEGLGYNSFAALSATLKDADAEAKNVPSDAGYTVSITFAELALDSNAELAARYGKYSQKEVFDALMLTEAAEGDTLDVQYVAREGGKTVTADVEALFQWFASNYTSYLADMLNNYVQTPIYTGEDGRHYIDVNYIDDVVLPVDATPDTVDLWADEGFDANTKWPIKTPQDIANEQIAVFLSRFDKAMKTDGNFDLMNELLGLGVKISDEIRRFADIRPFGYDPEGDASFTEIVYINEYVNAKTNKMFESEEGIALSMADSRAATSIDTGDISVNYGSNIAVPAGLEMPVNFNGQTANSYPDASVISRGSATSRPARKIIDVKINKVEAELGVPAVFYKEHTNTEKNPVISNPAGVEVIHIIAGLDLTSLDVDLDAVLSDPKDSSAVAKNVDPIVWVKLPNTLVNMKNLMADVLADLKKADEFDMPAEMDKIEKVLNMELNNKTKEYTWVDVVNLLEWLMGEDREQINKVLDVIKAQSNANVEGDLKVYFTDDAYPQDPGAYLNVGIAMDHNYVNGVTSALEGNGYREKLLLGKDYGIILVSPVLTHPNNGIQLTHEDFGAQNIYEMTVADAAKGLSIDAGGKVGVGEIYYYGFNNELAVHYEGDPATDSDNGRVVPTKPGIYFASAIFSETEDMSKVVGTDLAVLIIGMEKASIDVKRTVKVFDPDQPNIPYKADIVVKNEKGEDIANKAGRVVISGTVAKSEGASLRKLQADVNIDFPAVLDSAMSKAYEVVTGHKLTDEGITKATLTQSQVVRALEWCVAQIEAKKLDTKLSGWGVPDVLLDKMDTPEKLAIRVCNKLISEISSIDLEDNAQITFENNKTYSNTGVYLYYAMITDPYYITDADAEVLIIKAAEEDFVMEDQTKVYNGMGQLPDIEDETGRDYFMIVYDEQTRSISFLLDNDLDVMRKKLQDHGIINGKTIGEVFGAGDQKLEELSNVIVDGIVAQGEAIIDKLHSDKASSAYKTAMDKLTARVNSYRDTLSTKVQEKLLSLSKVVDRDTKFCFNIKPTNVGKYQIHAFSFAIAHEEATLTIIPEITITAGDVEINVGETPEFTSTSKINPETVAMPELDISYKVYKDEVAEGNEVALENLTAGTYIIQPYAEKDGYAFVFEPGTLTVKVTGIIKHNGNTLSLDGEVYINEYILVEGFDGVDINANGGLLLWDHEVTEDEATIDSESITANVEGLNTSGVEYTQQTYGFAAAEYANSVYIRPYVKIDESTYVYGPVVEFSVRKYCEAVIDRYETSALKSTCIALLHYGSAAQDYFKYNLGDYANKNIVAEYPVYDWDETLLTSLTDFTTNIVPSSNVKHTGKTLSLDTATKVNYYYKFTGEAKYAELLFWDGVTGDLTTSNTSYTVAMTYDSNTDEYTAQSKIFPAALYGKTIYACAHFIDENGESHYSDVVAFSPEAYAENIINNSKNANLVEAVKRMVTYGEFARIYFKK